MSTQQVEAAGNDGAGLAQTRGAGRQQAGKDKRSVAEWTTLSLVLLILAGLIGALIWHALQGGQDQPTFEVRIDEAAITKDGDTFHVPLELHNTGRATAEDVVVRATLMRGGRMRDETELTFTFVAGGETADGVAVFGEDPRGARVEATVVSYLLP